MQKIEARSALASGKSPSAKAAIDSSDEELALQIVAGRCSQQGKPRWYEAQSRSAAQSSSSRKHGERDTKSVWGEVFSRFVYPRPDLPAPEPACLIQIPGSRDSGPCCADAHSGLKKVIHCALRLAGKLLESIAKDSSDEEGAHLDSPARSPPLPDLVPKSEISGSHMRANTPQHPPYSIHATGW